MTTRFPSSRNTKSNFSRLFSGVSAAALFLGIGAGSAKADVTSTLVNNTTVVVTDTMTGFDFIFALGSLGFGGPGNLSYQVINNGLLDVNITATGNGSVTGFGVGILQFVVASASSSTDNITVSATNTDFIDIDAQAIGTSVRPNFQGIFQWVDHSAATGNAVSLSANNSGSIDIFVDASGPGTQISATGISQINIVDSLSAFNSVTLTASNSGSIDVLIQGTSAAGAHRGAGILQANQVSWSDVGDVSITGTNQGNIDITVFGSRTAIGRGMVQVNTLESAATAGDISFTLQNTSSMSIDVLAQVTGPNAEIFANGVRQLNTVSGVSVVGDVSMSIDNAGTINVTGIGVGTNANVAVEGLEQKNNFWNASGLDVAISANNSGFLGVNATANGTNGAVRGTGFEQFNVFQDYTAGNLTLDANNSGTVDIDVLAVGGNGAADAYGFNQRNWVYDGAATGNVAFNATNSSFMTLSILAKATGTSVTANAVGIAQAMSIVTTTSTVGDITFSVNNSGAVDVTAMVSGDNAQASATGFLQFNSFTNNSSVGNIDFSVVNSGNVDVLAQGMASGTGVQNVAASAAGVLQTAMATTSGSIILGFSNASTGSFNVGASAGAVGTSSAIGAKATGAAVGVYQVNSSVNQPAATYNFSNSGSMGVAANANASGGVTSNTATASAAGYIAAAGGANQTLNLNVSNGGSLNVNATANATNAVANAAGLLFNGAVLSGSVSNGGTISVTASAPSGSAQALGVQFNGDVNTTTFTNTGAINVLAIGSTTATAIGFGASTAFTNTVAPGSTDVATIVNDGGSISAWVNSGGTLDYGNAINTLGAPNPVMIDLQGGGSIVGNILIDNDDTVFVNNGGTYFEGTVNGASTLEGAFSVGSSGTFTMKVGAVSSEAKVFVNSFMQTSTGTLSFDITASTGNLGKITAVTADIDGTVHINIAPGLYDDYTFESVVSASTLTGTWSGVTTNTNSAFLSFAAQYPGDDTADIVLSRAAFNSLGGLTQNQMAVATDIENTYSTSLSGPYGMLVQDLLFMNATSYQAAVEQLHGSEHPQNLQSMLWSANLLNSTVGDRVNIGPYQTRGRSDAIARAGDYAVWVKAQGSWGEHDGDVEAPGYDQDQKALYAGFDFGIADNATLGFVGGYYKNELDFTNGNRIENDGYQFGLYGHYDNQKFYLRGLVGYGTFDADSWRSISVGSTVGTAWANYDIKVLSFNAEAGLRFEVGDNSYLTPYAGLNYADADVDDFDETGAGGANLSFYDNSATSFTMDFGARFSAALDSGSNAKFIPEFGVAWQHEFKDGIIPMNAMFSGVGGSGFTVISSNTDSGSILADAALTYASGGFEFKFGYSGRFNSQYKDHSVGVRLSVMFGT